MRYGLFSDVHGNLPALEATLAAFTRLGVGRYVCAGDVVGYGPYPAECIAAIDALEPAWVLGNHELLLLGRLPIESAPPLAQRTLQWTRAALSPTSWRRLEQLPLTVELPNGLVVTHGSLASPTLRILERAGVDTELSRLGREHPHAHMLVLGHTHRVLLADETRMLRWTGIRRRVPIDPAGRYIFNPGSVGQSRGFLGCARAAVLDTDANVLELLAISYETAELAVDLSAAGFPTWSHHRSPLRRFAERVERKVVKIARKTRWGSRRRVA